MPVVKGLISKTAAKEIELKNATKEASNQKIVDLINGVLRAEVLSGGSEVHNFAIDSPCKLTAYKTTVGFRKEAFIGEEQIRLLRAQLSDRRRDTVVVFWDGENGQELHLTLQEAADNVVGFSEWFQKAADIREADAHADVAREAEDKRTGFAADAAQCPEWGTW